MTSVFVFDRVGALARLDGDETLLAELIDIYLETAPSRKVALMQAFGASPGPDFERVVHLAHSFVGASRTVGAGQIAALASEIDDAARLHDERSLTLLLHKLDKVIEDFRQQAT